MDLNKKEIIWHLAQGVTSRVNPVAYSHIRRKLMEKQGVSEIALYSAVAEHLEENDIHPESYIDEMQTLMNEVSENIFFIKTSDEYSYLRRSFGAISMEGSPESKGEFLCIKCYAIKSSSERSTKPNYKNCCQQCYKAAAKESSIRYAQKQKEKKAELANAPTQDNTTPINEQPQNQTQTPDVQTVVSTQPDPTFAPFLEIESLTGDASVVMMSLSCNTTDLSKLLSLIDPFIVPPEEKEFDKPIENKAEHEESES